MDPIQAARHPVHAVVARSRSIAKSVLIGVGALVLTLGVETAPLFGMNPAGESIAETQSPRALEGVRQAGLGQPVFHGAGRSKTGPHTSGPLTNESARNLFLGFSIALDKMHEIPSCRDLFATYSTSGVEELNTSFYVAPSTTEKREFCVGGVTAFTQVGSRVTRLCPAFGNMDRWTAALTLIHEALHSAGMPESPSTAAAFTPDEINRLVKMACDL